MSSPSRPATRRRPGSSAGFSLVEMLVVLTITGLVMGLAVPALQSSLGRRGIDRSVTQLAALLREARSQAILSGSEAVVSLDISAKRAFPSWPGRDVGLGEPEAIEVTSAREELVTEAIPSFRFFPEGSATGGHIRLRYAGAEHRIAVDWLTGRVTRGQAE